MIVNGKSIVNYYYWQSVVVNCDLDNKFLTNRLELSAKPVQSVQSFRKVQVVLLLMAISNGKL